MNRQELIEFAKDVERYSWSEKGRDLDGAPYTAGGIARDFLDQAYLYYGNGVRRDGMYKVKAMVQQRKDDGEEHAEIICGNWFLWTVFNELGVSRVQK
jgi:hypothetical protein